MRRLLLLPSFVITFAILAGCSNDEPPKIHDIRGKVVSTNADQKTVRLNHEEIPGLMKAMEMNFSVEDARLLDGLAAGDTVAGKLKAGAGKYMLTELNKVRETKAEVPAEAPATIDEAAVIKANLAKFGPEDAKLAAAQRLCPVSEDPLGSSKMGVPVKLMINDQPIFICCKGCKGEVEKKQDEMLKKVAELKAEGK